MWLMDIYRNKNKIILWVKTHEDDLRIEKSIEVPVYLEADETSKKFLDENKIYKKLASKKTYNGIKQVYEIKAPVSHFEQYIRFIEEKTRHRTALYNADIKPEQLWMFNNRLKPFSQIDENLNSIEGDFPVLTKIELAVYGNPFKNTPIQKIVLNKKIFVGEEKEILKKLQQEFGDPDIIYMDYAFCKLPYLENRLNMHGLKIQFHRWDTYPLKYKGGKSFYSYGQVRYRDYAIRLHGRFLIDSSTMVGGQCDEYAIMELSNLSGAFFQQAASRSYGAIFQTALVFKMLEQNLLVPYKEKPIDKALSLFELLKSDRAGHTFDPKTGFHKNVAEIDFCSMFPWIIYNRNVSADTILCDKGPFEKVPGIPVKISHHHKGLVPLAIKPFIDRRMYYKKNPSAINKKRAIGLKWVLVTSYGYLRFREFKLGIPTSHMAICAYARETILEASKLAEDKGYNLVHGIIDSLYIKKRGIKEEDVKEFCKELEIITGIPVSFEGIFKWIVFLPSVVDKERPVPSRYYGALINGSIKARGIEVRQRSSPIIVKEFQQRALEILAVCNAKEEITEKFTELCRMLRATMKGLKTMDAERLSLNLCIGKSDYKHNIPQKYVVDELKKKEVFVAPGQNVKFVFQKNKIVLPDDYNGNPDVDRYKKLLVRSLFVLIAPFGFSKDDIIEKAGYERQSRLTEFVVSVFVEIKSDGPRRGLSEKQLRKRLEDDGWMVWRGGLIGIWKRDRLYPNVMKKYLLLQELLIKHYPTNIDHLEYLCAVHHGMPDLICYRNGVFKFVECKLGYEIISEHQKKCITILQKIGMNVEVHRVVEAPIMTRIATLNVMTGQKRVHERQMRLINRF